MSDGSHASVGRVVPVVALFALLGLPLVAYVWETLNQLMAGIVNPTRLAISLPAALLLAWLLVLLSRRVQRLDERRPE